MFTLACVWKVYTMRVLHDARFLPSFDLLQAVAREEVLTLQARELPLFSPSPPLVLSFLLLRLHWGHPLHRRGSLNKRDLPFVLSFPVQVCTCASAPLKLGVLKPGRFKTPCKHHI